MAALKRFLPFQILVANLQRNATEYSITLFYIDLNECNNKTAIHFLSTLFADSFVNWDFIIHIYQSVRSASEQSCRANVKDKLSKEDNSNDNSWVKSV